MELKWKEWGNGWDSVISYKMLVGGDSTLQLG